MERKKRKNFKVMDKYILYQTEYNEKKKNVTLSVVLGVFLGILGLIYASGSTFLVMLMCLLGSLFFLLALVGPVSFSILVPFVVFFFYILSIYLCYSKAKSYNDELIKTLKKKYFEIEQEELVEPKQGIDLIYWKDPATTQEKQETDPTIIFCIFLVIIALLWVCGLF